MSSCRLPTLAGVNSCTLTCACQSSAWIRLLCLYLRNCADKTPARSAAVGELWLSGSERPYTLRYYVL